MKLLILMLLINSYILKKYEKGNEHFYSFLLALILTLVYFYEPIQFYTRPLCLLFEITLPIFLFFQIYPFIKHSNQRDILVVLGCGLLDKNRISPLLMKRLDVAYELYQNKSCKIVVSGGKGKDEEISEAIAMKTYLINRGIFEEDILCEEKSRSTKENLIYSKEIIDSSFMVITSDYHALRVYILSKLLGLNVQISTSKTIYYYKFYAIAREYVAVLFIFKEIIIIFYFLILTFNHYFLFNLS